LGGFDEQEFFELDDQPGFFSHLADDGVGQ
jgi:hypothetical protein